MFCQCSYGVALISSRSILIKFSDTSNHGTGGMFRWFPKMIWCGAVMKRHTVAIIKNCLLFICHLDSFGPSGSILVWLDTIPHHSIFSSRFSHETCVYIFFCCFLYDYFCSRIFHIHIYCTHMWHLISPVPLHILASLWGGHLFGLCHWTRVTWHGSWETMEATITWQWHDKWLWIGKGGF